LIFSFGAKGSVLRRYGKSCYPFLWQKQPLQSEKEPQLLKQLKPHKLLKLFCHTISIKAILDGLSLFQLIQVKETK